MEQDAPPLVLPGKGSRVEAERQNQQLDDEQRNEDQRGKLPSGPGVFGHGSIARFAYTGHFGGDPGEKNQAAKLAGVRPLPARPAGEAVRRLMGTPLYWFPTPAGSPGR